MYFKKIRGSQLHVNQVNDAYDSMIRGVFPYGSKTSYNKLIFSSPKIINFFMH